MGGRRTRLEKLKVEDYVKKTESDYVDIWEEYKWIDLQKFLKDRGVHKQYKTEKARVKYIESIGLTLQPDANGKLGVAVALNEEGIRNMKRGKRLAVTKEKVTGVESREEAQELLSRGAAALNVSSHSQQAACYWRVSLL